MTSRTFYTLEEGYGVDSWLTLAGFKQTPNLDNTDIICFNGGADIATDIYGERPALRGVPHHRSYRDEHEVEVFGLYKMDPSKLKLGICRGAQLLNCLNGGTLWQDVNNHGHDHQMTVLETGHTMYVTSTHHQMMRPNYPKAVIVGVTKGLATYKLAQDCNYPDKSYPDDGFDTEIVYYPDTNSLCVQGHPEYVPGSEFAEYCVELVKQYLRPSVAKWGAC